MHVAYAWLCRGSLQYTLLEGFDLNKDKWNAQHTDWQTDVLFKASFLDVLTGLQTAGPSYPQTRFCLCHYHVFFLMGKLVHQTNLLLINILFWRQQHYGTVCRKDRSPNFQKLFNRVFWLLCKSTCLHRWNHVDLHILKYWFLVHNQYESNWSTHRLAMYLKSLRGWVLIFCD